ncbi:SusC/RagA family TonB-linked outer membrane protein [Flavobacterium cupreum]|uniref:SusC/RagA family TonB-linked outer membrane protein n=3 Tax=Flavobacterium TaxID=237 RepID=A0A940XA97_9FLAO|nr:MULTISPECIES: SusC/RagA family TonB-linked outer membrane protein [Flavobacterium]MBP4139785.1 SusC/RagA family TonB-linked outer membrane protein [Flavobacterium geliluteum]RUT67773.1 SusC/RagA family TonB-linked outer membrane protein [Flavobacterium cupreum]TCN50553.1 TonB-linked SusC/RagA family outer membrane protein [Flavobacterium circumlabens]TDO68875.1 TonB-linked SusC/RagA family outer membrane protein [Flavobacterium sp. P3160]TEB41801.1 SusC/RagA family TonB-linked outer membran
MKNLSFNKGRPSCLCIFILAILLSSQIYAAKLTFGSYTKQSQHQITGTVTDATGPLSSVTVIVKGTTTNTVTDEKGNFSITANSTDILVFSFIGYAPREIQVGSQTSINIVLIEDSTQLKEVTINAGYYSVKEKERTGSIAKIKSADLDKQPVNNPLAAMQGRMSGVNITQNTGLPGGGFNIQIRGINSIRGDGNDPLYIVNGVPYSSQSLGDPTVSASAISGVTNPLNNLNPSDIESIEVLKDADATAIYGSRGANGVVLITTKKGKSGETRFNFNAFTTVGKVAQKMNLMNTSQYLAMRAEAFANDGITEYPEDAYDINGTWDSNRNTDWQKELIGGTSYIQNFQASVSGGNANTQFLLSGTYRKETTVFPGDFHYGKGSVNSNITHQSDDKRFTLNFSASYSGDKNTLPGRDLTSRAYTLAPNAPELYNSDGSLNWENGTFNNPLAFLNGRYLTANQNLIANVLLSYNVLPGLEAKASIGYNDTRITQNVTSPLSIYSPFDTNEHESSLFVASGTGRSYIFEPQLNYRKELDDIEINFLVGTTFQSQKTTKLAQSAFGFASDALINSLAAATTVTVLNHEVTEYNYNALFGRLNMNWHKKYIVNLTGRRDGSSRFGPDNRFANFGAAGAAWLFTNEGIFKQHNSILSFGKLRGSYGITGNDQIGDYQYLDTYQVSPYLYDGVVGLLPSRLYNPDFGWETNKKLELALELGFLKDNIFLSAAWFRNRSSNQLVGVPLPGTTGFSSIQSNFDATVENTGVEVELRTTNVKSKDFSWTTTVNLTVPKNKLVSFPGLEGSTYANQLIVGESLFIKKVFNYAGINPETGAYTFQDFNGDGQITYEDDRQAIVDTSPEYYGGLSNQLTYKNWSLDFLFQFVKQLGRNYLYTSALPGSFVNQPVDMGNHFPQDGTNAVSQQYTTGQNGTLLEGHYNLIDSNAAFSDASFVRLKNLTLVYAIPSTWSKTFTGKIYVQGQNLLTLTDFRGADPENQSASALPSLRQFTLGIQLGF